MAHTDTVQQIYDAFGRGDTSTILTHLADDVEWEYGGVSTDVPWLQRREGRERVGPFFDALQALEFQQFAPTILLASGSIVVALCHVDATVRATGKRFVEEDEVHIWHFDSAGKVARFRHRADTHLQWAAYKGCDVP